MPPTCPCNRAQESKSWDSSPKQRPGKRPLHGDGVAGDGASDGGGESGDGDGW